MVPSSAPRLAMGASSILDRMQVRDQAGMQTRSTQAADVQVCRLVIPAVVRGADLASPLANPETRPPNPTPRLPEPCLDPETRPPSPILRLPEPCLDPLTHSRGCALWLMCGAVLRCAMQASVCPVP